MTLCRIALVLLALVALLVIVFQNIETVPVRFLFWAFEAQRAAIFVGFFVLGLAAGLAFPVCRRSRPKGSPLGGAVRAAYFADFAAIDIALDPFPYNGTNSTCDALWMGVPVVTLAGETTIGRTGVSLLSAVGHPEWIAPDQAGYVEIAAALARDPAALVATRTRLRDEFTASAICDGPGFVRALDDAFRDMWRRHVGGGGPPGG